MNEETHSVLVIFVFEREVDVVSAWWDQFDSLEKGPCLPVLVVDAKLHGGRHVQEKQETILSYLLS